AWTASSGPCWSRDRSIGDSPANRSVSVNDGNGTKCITMPLANHIANNRQNPTPSQRWTRTRAFMARRLPLEGRRHLIGSRRAEQDLIGIERITPDRVAAVEQVANPERQAGLVHRREE